MILLEFSIFFEYFLFFQIEPNLLLSLTDSYL